MGFSPHTGHSLARSPDVYRNNFLFLCHRGFLQVEFPEDCRYTLSNTVTHKSTSPRQRSFIHNNNVKSQPRPLEVLYSVRRLCGSNLVSAGPAGVSYLCSLQAHRSARNAPACSARSVLPPRWLYSGTDRRSARLGSPSCRHRVLRSESPRGRSHRLQKQDV